MWSVFILWCSIQLNPFTQLQQVGDTMTTRNIYFDYNKAVILPESCPHLDSLAAYLHQKENIKMEVGVHTDWVNPKYSARLSSKRAEAIVDYLTQKGGIDKSRLLAKGYGDMQPIVEGVNLSQAQRHLNRRVVYKVLDM